MRLAGFTAGEADGLFGAPPSHLSIDVTPEPPSVAQARYVQRFRVLMDAVTGGETDAAFATE